MKKSKKQMNYIIFDFTEATDEARNNVIVSFKREGIIFKVTENEKIYRGYLPQKFAERVLFNEMTVKVAKIAGGKCKGESIDKLLHLKVIS